VKDGQSVARATGIGRATAMLAVFVVAPVPGEAFAFGPRTLAELRANRAECVSVEPTAALSQDMSRFEAEFSMVAPDVATTRLCHAFVKRLSYGDVHRQYYCRVIARCGYAEISHMADHPERRVDWSVASRAGDCDEQIVRRFRMAFLHAFLTCASPDAKSAAMAHVEDRFVDYENIPVVDPYDADAVQRLSRSFEEPDISAACGAMCGARARLSSDEGPVEKMFLAKTPTAQPFTPRL
jgi:hypothetical protein